MRDDVQTELEPDSQDLLDSKDKIFECFEKLTSLLEGTFLQEQVIE